MLSFILFWLWSHFSAPVALRIGATRHPIFGADLFILIGGGISNSLVIAKKKNGIELQLSVMFARALDETETKRNQSHSSENGVEWHL